MSRICICGGGSLGHVCAGVFASCGNEVTILSGHPSKWTDNIVVTDNDGRQYCGRISRISDKPEEVVSNSDIVFLCLPGYLIEKTLTDIKPYIGKAVTGSVVASTGFFKFAHSILGPGAALFAFQRTPFIARVKEYGKSAYLLGYKKELLAAVENAADTEGFALMLEDLFRTRVRMLPSWQEAALSNSNPILHTSRLYSMFGESDGKPLAVKPLFYKDWTDGASDVLIAMDGEFMELVRFVCGKESSIQPLLEYYESHDSSSLTAKISSIPAFQTIESPLREVEGGWVPDTESRYFTEDFSFGLKFIWEMCHQYSVPCPTIDRVYAWGCALIGQGLSVSYNPQGSVLRKAQLRMLDILVEVDRICRKCGIDYWMDAGTLLGAVRHGGFIPWDDDMDICINRKDRRRFRKAMEENLSDRFAYQDCRTDKYHFEMSPRIRDTHSFFDLPIERKQKFRGLFLDVVLLERIPSMRVQHLIYLLYGRVTRTIHNYGEVMYDSAFRKFATKLAAYLIWPAMQTALGIIRLYSELTRSDILGRYYVGFRNPRYLSHIYPLTEIYFEGHRFYAPGNFDGYLKAMFGDYMALPPEGQRGGHDVKIEVYD
ncbi:MAG: NAD/NADP octopine/nopaline dehydrogenase family protein [Bacteroidales bacterium]|nr:NAD/NADP octopine/nopaline dehydrogenase family protein [Bacteroidales bacterium]